MLIGIDLGFSQVKLVEGNKHFVFPSLIGNPSNFELEKENQEIIDDLVVSTNDLTYYVGKKALETNNSRFCMSTDKTNSSNDKVTFLASLGLVKGKEVDVVTGLPVEDFKKKGLKEKLVSNMKGIHTFQFRNKTMTTNVTSVKVIPQAAGAFYDFLLTDKGKPKKEANEILNGIVRVIDIGFKTTDIITMAYGEYKGDKSCTIQKGMIDIHKELARYLNATYDRNLPLSQMNDICRNQCFVHDGKIINLSKEIYQIEYPIAETILNESNALLGDTKEVNLVIGVGGTMSVVSQFFSKYYNCFTLNNIEFSNADGYYKYGLFTNMLSKKGDNANDL